MRIVVRAIDTNLAAPSTNAIWCVSVDTLSALRLSRIYDSRTSHVTEEVVTQVADHLLRAVTGFGTILQAIEFLTSPARELVIVGAPDRRVALEQAAADRYLPWLAVAPTPDADGLPMFEGREPFSDEPLAYLCENQMCLMPAKTAAELAAMLK